MKFNGYLRVRVGEAVGLQPTRWSLRHSLFKKGHQLLDPYLTVSVDQVRVGQTSTKQRTNKPTYNEEFCANVTDGGHLELAVFHETPLGYDHFVANCTLQFQELLRTAGTSDTFEGWVSEVGVGPPGAPGLLTGVSPCPRAPSFPLVSNLTKLPPSFPILFPFFCTSRKIPLGLVPWLLVCRSFDWGCHPKGMRVLSSLQNQSGCGSPLGMALLVMGKV